jgi:membrane-associated phospholipid phosphatase
MRRPADHPTLRRAAPHTVLVVTTIVGLVCAAAMTAASAKIYDSVVERDGVAGLDQPVLDAMVDLRRPWLNTVVRWYTDLGSALILPVIAAIGAGMLVWLWRSWTPALIILIAGAGSLTMSRVGKAAVDRERPDQSLAVPPFETSPAFPSGHTLNSTVIFVMIAYLLACRLQTTRARAMAIGVAVVLSLLMGLTRVYLGAHWLTDVLVGWTLAVAWVLILVTAHRLAASVERDRDPHLDGQDPTSLRPSG